MLNLPKRNEVTVTGTISKSDGPGFIKRLEGRESAEVWFRIRIPRPDNAEGPTAEILVIATVADSEAEEYFRGLRSGIEVLVLGQLDIEYMPNLNTITHKIIADLVVFV